MNPAQQKLVLSEFGRRQTRMHRHDVPRAIRRIWETALLFACIGTILASVAVVVYSAL